MEQVKFICVQTINTNLEYSVFVVTRNTPLPVDVDHIFRDIVGVVGIIGDELLVAGQKLTCRRGPYLPGHSRSSRDNKGQVACSRTEAYL